ncbi:DUF1003 domain-containing protein [Candidatus Berkelbacteria bacterium]|nr:DUF1003 domain-containing protein [Candidatus Berkelbacteria bacterium]
MAKKHDIFDFSVIRDLFRDAVDQSLSKEERHKKREELVESFKARSDRNRSWGEKLADELSGIFGSVEFIVLNALGFIFWIAWNLEWIPGFIPFDPFPFNLLTMVVSLEAIFLSLFVLLSQNRAGKVADMREEVDLNINLLTEQEVTKLLNMVDDIHRHLKLKKGRDRKLEELKKDTNVKKLESDIEQSVEDAQNGEQ